jgi:hypothetical protein
MNDTLKNILFQEKNGEISHTKLWSNIGYFLMCSAFIGITIIMGLGYVFPVTTWIDLFMVFGAMVAIPRGFSKWVAYKQGKCIDGTTDTKQ